MEKLCVAASDRATVFGDYVISLEVGKDFTYHVEKDQDDRALELPAFGASI